MSAEVAAPEKISFFLTLDNCPAITGGKSLLAAELWSSQRTGPIHLQTNREVCKTADIVAWTTPFVLDYKFEVSQELTVKLNNGAGFNCEAKFTVVELLRAPYQYLSRDLGGKKGMVHIRGECPISQHDRLVATRISASKLVNKAGMFGKSDPMFCISRMHEDGQWSKVWQSGHVMNNLNPVWSGCDLPVTTICNGDIYCPLRIDVFDWNDAEPATHMGRTRDFTIMELFPGGLECNGVGASKPAALHELVLELMTVAVAGKAAAAAPVAVGTICIHEPQYHIDPSFTALAAKAAAMSLGTKEPSSPPQPPAAAPALAAVVTSPPKPPATHSIDNRAALAVAGGAAATAAGAAGVVAAGAAAVAAAGGIGIAGATASVGGAATAAAAAGLAVVGGAAAVAIGGAAVAGATVVAGAIATKMVGNKKSAQPIEHSFLSYISGGCEVSLILGIDFTGSNNDPDDIKSLHYQYPAGSGLVNPYEQAIKSVLAVLEPYDEDKKYPVFGFGMRVPVGGGSYSKKAEFAHPVVEKGKTEVVGMDGVLKAYKSTVFDWYFSGPTNLAPLINKAADLTLNEGFSQEKQKYSILLILTDGLVDDMDETKRAIIEASTLPLSIIIVGIGKDQEGFAKMKELDCDGAEKLRVGDMVAERDIVQFVAMDDVVSAGAVNADQLAEEVLKEVPTQLLEFMKSCNVTPNKRK